MPEPFDPLQLYEALMRVLGTREEAPTQAQTYRQGPYEPPQGYQQDAPSGRVPDNPGWKPTDILQVIEQPWWQRKSEHGPAETSMRWLADKLFDYYRGGGLTNKPEDVERNARILRELQGERPRPELYYLEPDWEEQLLRYMGYKRTPDGRLERIPEEDKPPLG